MNSVVADADPGHHLHVAGSLEFGFAEAGSAERHAMDRRLLPQQGFEIPGRYHIGEFDELDVVPRLQQDPSLLRHRFGDENFLLVGRHSVLPSPGFSCCAAAKGRRRAFV
jgi:hypothetical protein